MKKMIAPTNNIKSLSKKKGLTARVLAEKIGTSAPHMSRLMRGQSPLTMKWLLKLSAALKVPTHQIADLEDGGRKFKGACDDTLLGSVMGWLMEAGEAKHVKLKRQDLTKLTSFIYKEAVERPLSFDDTKYLAFTVIATMKLLRK